VVVAAAGQYGLMDWSDFYTDQVGRSLRPTFVHARDIWRERHGDRVGDAIDLGCGDGLESRALLHDGWRVLAIDSDPHVVERVTSGVPADESVRLTVRRASYEELADELGASGNAGSPATPAGGLPAADFVYAGFALPFCPPAVFERLWAGIRSSLRSGGLFAGQIFGPKDDFASWPDVNVHDRADVDRLLAGLDVVQLREEDKNGTSFRGPKHWHVFHVIAAQP